MAGINAVHFKTIHAARSIWYINIMDRQVHGRNQCSRNSSSVQLLQIEEMLMLYKTKKL